MENNHKWVNLSFFASAALLAFIVFLVANRAAAALDFEGRIQNLEMYIKIGAVVVGAIGYLILNQNIFLHSSLAWKWLHFIDILNPIVIEKILMKKL